MKRIIAALTAFLIAAQSLAAVVNFTEISATTNLPNPERGEAKWSGNDIVASYEPASTATAASGGHRMVMCRVNLSAYRTIAIDAGFISTLTANLADIRSKGLKCVIWMYYNFDQTGNDATPAQITAHLQQLAPTLNANADVIAYWKAGFAGNYGEWWGSSNGSTSASGKLTVRQAIESNVPENIIVQYRYPADIMTWYSTVLGGENWYSGGIQARTGFHNDCWMSTDQVGGVNDTGTYSNNTTTGNAQRAYMQALSEFTPYGGEVSQSCPNPRDACSVVLTEAPAYHLTWIKDLASGDAAGYVSSWTSGGCLTTIRATMGYRIVYRSLTTPTSIAKGAVGTFALTLNNTGWSRMHHGRRVQVILKRQGGAETITGTSYQTLQILPSQSAPGTTMPMTIRVAVPGGAVSGTYDVYLKIPDIWSTTQARAFTVRPAVVDGSGVVWNDSTGELATGVTVSIP